MFDHRDLVFWVIALTAVVVSPLGAYKHSLLSQSVHGSQNSFMTTQQLQIGQENRSRRSSDRTGRVVARPLNYPVVFRFVVRIMIGSWCATCYKMVKCYRAEYWFWIVLNCAKLIHIEIVSIGSDRLESMLSTKLQPRRFANWSHCWLNERKTRFARRDRKTNLLRSNQILCS